MVPMIGRGPFCVVRVSSRLLHRELNPFGASAGEVFAYENTLLQRRKVIGVARVR